MSDKFYNILKYICIVALPALTTLYGVIGATCHIPYTQETLTILAALDTCIGSLIGISSARYYQIKSNDNYSVSEVMKAVEKWMTDNQISASDMNADVPEE